MKSLIKKILNKDARIFLRRAFYSGTKYNCSVCSSNLRTMFTGGCPFPVLSELDVIGGETIPNDICPVCFANSRARLLFEYIRRETKIEKHSSRFRLLHFAPEYGILCRLKAIKDIDYVAVDLNPVAFGDIGGVAYCDVTAIDFENNSFDLIICSHVLEHVPEDRVAIKELFRVLKRDGIAILQVPISASLQRTIEDPFLTDPQERERRFGQHDHVRIYGADYPTRLREGGFSVEAFDPTGRWGAAIVENLRLNPREKIFLGKKME